MIRAVANQKIDLSKEEYDYYLELEKKFGKDSFIDLFRTNSAGQIISVLPPQAGPTAMLLIFFLLNVMFNQRLRKLGPKIDKIMKIEERLELVEERLRLIEEK